MKKILLFSLSTFLLGSIMTKTTAQIYMAAGQENVKYINFQEVKTLKINNISEETVLFTKNALLPQKVKANSQNCNCNLSSPSYVAAMTLNKRGNIVAMNMTGTQVYVSMPDGTVKILNIDSEAITVEHGLFARMATAPDGSIYALNNSGSQLLKITDDEQIMFLGAVEGFAEIFAEKAEKRSSYGGDMIVDTEGNLLVFTAFGMVVKVNPETLSAEYVGQISGLPEGYTVNGVAVTDENAIILASSQPKDVYFTDINTLEASFAAGNTTPVYDLAGKNFLKIKPENPNGNISLSVSPTMVKKSMNGIFNIKSNIDANGIALTVYSADGKLALKQTRQLYAGDNQVDINGFLPGVYFVNIADVSGGRLLIDKITVE
jgi:hypothetical protein